MTSHDSGDSFSGLEDLVAEVLMLPIREQASAFDKLRSDHPDHSDLLRRWEHAARTIEPGATQLATNQALIREPTENPPEEIAGYEILRMLGRGGMGTVYLAQQHAPIRREVAVKVIKLGMDSAQILRRFDLERQALAKMSHENIAHVYDAGSTDAGRPYFAMEFVDGVPLTVYADREQLSLTGRIEILRQVCAGIQHAHQNGVVHRDLKPANILVKTVHGRPVPKIIDFGLARAIDVQHSESMHTADGALLGTPEYMSPEQADPTLANVDTRTDIYSVGVVLYELLTGLLPFPSAELRRAGTLEMQRRIRDDEAPRPSHRVSTAFGEGSGTRRGDSDTRIDIASDTAAIAKNRRVSPQSLKRELRGELDWIVLMAMAKEPDRRYQTLEGLSADLARYLSHEPVSAGPPSARYRMRKMIRRYRIQVTALVAVFIALLAGAISTTWFAIESNARSKEADRQRETANARIRDFDMLSGIVHLRSAKEAETELYPAWPDRIAALQRWLDEDWGSIESALPRLRTTLGNMRGRGRLRPATEAAIAAWRTELESMQTQLAALLRCQAVREGRTQHQRPALDPEVQAMSVSDLHAKATPLIILSTTIRVFGREAEGLAIAEFGWKKSIGSNRTILADLVAWARFANGLDQSALEAAKQSVELAPRANRFREHAVARLQWLERAVESARKGSVKQEIAVSQERVNQYRRTRGRLNRWDFVKPSDQALHDSLAELLADIEDYENRNLAAVRERLRWATDIGAISIESQRARWTRASAAISAADGVEASEMYRRRPALRLAPQIGLVPIGMNPQTKLWEFYHLASALDPTSIPEHQTDGSIHVTEETGIVFVLIPGGRTEIGARDDDRMAPKSQLPATSTFLNPYFLARHEITIAQWKRLSGGAEPNMYPAGKLDITPTHPVERVDWVTAERTLWQHGLALPTEAQWEHACRANTDTPWWTGANRESLIGAVNMADVTSRQAGHVYATDWREFTDGYVLNAPVHSLRPNPWGFYHIYGNVSEWCRDRAPTHPTPMRDGDGLRDMKHGDETFRMIRGGDYGADYKACRSSNSFRIHLRSAISRLGVRAARRVVTPSEKIRSK